MNIYPRTKLPVTEVKKFIVIFYAIGTLGFLLPFTKDLFTKITPLALILGVYLLAVYHDSYSPKALHAYFLIFALGFFVEAVGVNTGLIFGPYRYGSALGTKAFNTPLIIGVNWLFLTYTSTSITQSFKIKDSRAAIVAPLLMLLYDVILEQAAPKMDMWHWKGTSVPLRNYLAWYIIGLAFVSLIKLLKLETKNPLSGILFSCQFLFFVLLSILLR